MFLHLIAVVYDQVMNMQGVAAKWFSGPLSGETKVCLISIFYHKKSQKIPKGMSLKKGRNRWKCIYISILKMSKVV